MAADDEFGFRKDDASQDLIANLEWALLGIAKDIQSSDAALKNMNLLVLENNASIQMATKFLAQFSAGLEKILPDLKLLPLSEVNVSDGNGGNVSDDYRAKPDESSINMQAIFNGAIGFGYVLQITDSEIKHAMRNEGFSGAQIEQADNESGQLSRTILGASQADNLNLIYNLDQIFKNSEQAMQARNSLLRGGAIANSTTGENEDDIDHTAFYATQLHERSKKIFNSGTHKISGKNAGVLRDGLADFVLAKDGHVSAHNFSNMDTRAGPAFVSQMMSPALFRNIVPVIAGMNGLNVAPALAALGQTFTPKAMSQNEILALRHIGVTPGGALYESNQVAWLETVLARAVQSHGYNTQAQQSIFLDKLLKGNFYLPKLQGLINHLDKIEFYSKNYQFVAQNPENSDEFIAHNNPALRLNMLTDSVDAFLTMRDKIAEQQRIYAPNYLTDFVNKLYDFTKPHPDIGLAGIDMVAAEAAIAAGVATYEAIKQMNSMMKILTGGHFVRPYAEDRLLPYDGYDPHNQSYETYRSHVDSPFILTSFRSGEQEKIYNVWIVNPGDLHNATAKSIARQLHVQTGPTGFDSSFGIPIPAGISL